MKILIVDDEALVRRSLARAFASRGHEIYEAVDGIEGSEKWKQLNPDVVILDVLMPGKTGPELLSEMRPSSKAVVIMISAFSGEHNMESALKMGAQAFIPKPFEDIFSVCNEVESLLS